MKNKNKNSFFIKTFGCRLNQLDSAKLEFGLSKNGMISEKSEENSEVIFINSCIVTNNAEKKVIHFIKKLVHDGKRIILFGCGPKANFQKWTERFPEIEIFKDKSEIFEHFEVDQKHTNISTFERTRVHIEIQKGCDNTCTFCITTIARGNHESVPQNQIIKQIKRAEKMNVKEIVLTGIQLAGYGCANTNKPKESKLPELLNEILEKTKIQRIRLSSLGPQFLDNRFFDVFKNERICDHLHLSIQSGSEKIVKLMNRGHGISEIFEIAEKSKKSRKSRSLTADFITGFPGESELDFSDTVKMIEKLEFLKTHIFPFSERSGTVATNFKNSVPKKIRKSRADFLRKFSEKISQKFLNSQIGLEKEFLVEKNNQATSKNFIKIKIPDSPEFSDLKQNKIFKKKIEKSDFKS